MRYRWIKVNREWHATRLGEGYWLSALCGYDLDEDIDYPSAPGEPLEDECPKCRAIVDNYGNLG